MTFVVAGVLEERDLAPIKDFMDGIKPWKAVFDPKYVKKLNGTHVKKGKSLRDLADQVSADIANFKKDHGLKTLRSEDALECMQRIWTQPTMEVHGRRA